jgi:hypothetical protein
MRSERDAVSSREASRRSGRTAVFDEAEDIRWHAVRDAITRSSGEAEARKKSAEVSAARCRRICVASRTRGSNGGEVAASEEKVVSWANACERKAGGIGVVAAAIADSRRKSSDGSGTCRTAKLAQAASARRAQAMARREESTVRDPPRRISATPRSSEIARSVPHGDVQEPQLLLA